MTAARRSPRRLGSDGNPCRPALRFEQGDRFLVEGYEGCTAEPLPLEGNEAVSKVPPASSIAKPASAAGRFTATFPVFSKACKAA